jgi:hypothetical protein
MPKDEITSPRHSVFYEAQALATGLLGAACSARKAFESAQAAGRQKLSERGWTRGLLHFAGHDEAVVAALEKKMTEAPHLFPNGGAYVHQVGRLIADGFWWGPGTTTPTTGGTDKDLAQMEVQQVAGANLFSACVLAVGVAAKMNPAAFGPHDDLGHLARGGAQLAERAERALAEWRRVPEEIVLGMAIVRDVSLEPRGSVYERMIDHALASPATPRRPSPRTGGAVVVGR